jgi:valyl-tRNA synthetase
LISPPERISLEGLESKWAGIWEERQVYRFDRSVPKEAVFAIDTPPPTVSGSLHIGHVFSYTHADVVARYQRMQGKEVFYPIGWDDNGVPTERRVQNYFNIRCEPSMEYQPDFEPQTSSKEHVPVSRRNFIELCERLTANDEQAFEHLWRHIGLSVDWSMAYNTVGTHSRLVSQAAFLQLVSNGKLRSVEAPTLWDVDFQTAVSQAELEDRTVDGMYHRIRFALREGGSVEIESSRPELLPACVALVCHPEDSRYRKLVGKYAVTPLFSVPVPIISHELAEPEKGTGLAMVCTFGDLTDVIWWREAGLPLRLVIGRDGRLVPSVDFKSAGSLDLEAAERAYQYLAGKRAVAARKEIAEQLRQASALIGDPQPVRHQVKFYEKGDRPLEIVASRQWFISILDLKDRLLELGRELKWLPEHMKVRYDDWVRGLNSDWNISRQRYFGIPIPVWYPIDQEGQVGYDHPIFPEPDDLPVDPQTTAPRGYSEDQRNKPGGFCADPDVLDTWATSSLTPQIAGGWLTDQDLFEKVFPMDLRPQGQEIIRTWLFYTVVRSELGFGTLPFSHALISGFVLDPDRKKMSKSKGNVVTPMPLVEKYGADAIRYWAASGRPGVDTAADEGQMKVGRRLAIKVANATKFALTILSSNNNASAGSLVPLDLAMLKELDEAMSSATRALGDYEYTKALETIETFFWRFCDYYLELVKLRAYGTDPSPLGAFDSSQSASARISLEIGIELLLRAFAPYLPFVTEEAWSWWHEGSIHRYAWPQPGEAVRRYLKAIGTDDPGEQPQYFRTASSVLSAIRKAKSESKVSIKTPVANLKIVGPEAYLQEVAEILADLSAAGVVNTVDLLEGPEERVEIMLEHSGEPKQ